jgi:hypothetical protein
MVDNANPQDDVLAGWGEIAPPQPPVNTTEDVAKSVAAKGTLGFTSTLGIPGGVTSWAQDKLLSGVGSVSPEMEADVRRGLLEGLSDEERSRVEEGLAVRTKEGLMPTMIGMEKMTKEALPYTQYEPKETLSRYAGAAAEFAGANLPMAVVAPGNVARNVSSELVLGGISGVGSEAGADWAKSIGAPEYEGYGRLLGAIATPMAAQGLIKSSGDLLGSLGRSSIGVGAGYVDKKVAALIAEDLRNGSSPLTLKQVQDELLNGNAPSLYDLAGKKTRAYLREVYKLTPEIEKGIDELNALTAARKADAAADSMDYINRNFPDIGNFSVEAAALQSADVATNAAYKLSREMPKAQNMWTPELIDLATSDVGIQRAMKDVDQFLSQQRVGGFGADKYNLDLSYWDMVKKRMDDYIGAVDPGNKLNVKNANRNEFAALTDAKKKLVALLDEAVPEYAEARGAALDKLNVKNAPEAGEKMFKASNTRSFEESMDVFNKLNPEQQELFRRGFVRSVYDQLGSGKSLNSLVKKLSSQNAKKYYTELLGEEQYSGLVGTVTAAEVRGNLQAIVESNLGGKALEFIREGGNIVRTAGGVGALIGGATTPSAGAIAGGIITVADLIKNKLVFNYAERKVAPEVIRLMQSSDPKDLVRLGRLVNRNRDAQLVASKFAREIGRYVVALGLGEKKEFQQDQEILKGWGEPAPPRTSRDVQMQNEQRFVVPDVVPGLNDGTERASGGRVGRKSGGRVSRNRISDEVARTRVMLGEKTASILSVPDDAIISALQIARKR